VARNPAKQRESAVETHLRESVEGLGGMCIKAKDPARRGMPDRIVLVPGGTLCFVELKRPKRGVLAAHQKRYHRDLIALGFDALTLWTIAEVDEFIAGVAD
jgi:hypothetical protein